MISRYKQFVYGCINTNPYLKIDREVWHDAKFSVIQQCPKAFDIKSGVFDLRSPLVATTGLYTNLTLKTHAYNFENNS